MENHLENEEEMLIIRQLEQKARKDKAKVSLQFTPLPSIISQVASVPRMDSTEPTFQYDATNYEGDHHHPINNDSENQLLLPPRGIAYEEDHHHPINNDFENQLLFPPRGIAETARRISPRKAKSNYSSGPLNIFVGLNYEAINTLLHRKFPMSAPGKISLNDFNYDAAKSDLASLLLLREGEVIDDTDLIMIGLWIKKFQVAISSENNSDSDSDSDDDDSNATN